MIDSQNLELDLINSLNTKPNYNKYINKCFIYGNLVVRISNYLEYDNTFYCSIMRESGYSSIKFGCKNFLNNAIEISRELFDEFSSLVDSFYDVQNHIGSFKRMISVFEETTKDIKLEFNKLLNENKHLINE